MHRVVRMDVGCVEGGDLLGYPRIKSGVTQRIACRRQGKAVMRVHAMLAPRRVKEKNRAPTL
jgi:hypothetical protein